MEAVSRNWLVWTVAIIIGIFMVCLPNRGLAQMGEVKFGFSYSRQNYSAYSPDSFAFQRTYSASVGYYFTPLTMFELSFQDTTSRTFLKHLQDSSYHDRLISVNYVQGLLPRAFFIQPFLRAGIGQLNRDTESILYDQPQAGTRVDSVTIVMGTGAKVFISRRIAINLDLTSYISRFNFALWRDNMAATVGISLYF